MKKIDISENALTVLQKRYLKKDKLGNTIETPEQLFERVADNIAKAELFGPQDKEIEKQKQKLYEHYKAEFYRIMSELKFLPNTPCLVNAGGDLQMLSACFAIGIHDSMNGIFNTAKAAALISKAGGGFGINFSTLRPAKELVSSTVGMASGPISFLQIFDSLCGTISQGGIRRGAMMAMLDISHPDIEQFITCKDDGKSLSNMNISVCVTDEFMEAVQNNSQFKLTFNGKVYKKIKAKELWDKLCEHAWKNGDPGIFFVDEANRHNVINNTKITTTNPCIAGSSIIAVADGRNGVTIEQLANEGKDVPVYSVDTSSNKIEIKYARSPRKTGEKIEVWKLTLDDNSSLIATPDHKFLTKKLEYKELKNLSVGESLFPFNSYINNRYRQIHGTSKRVDKDSFHLSRRQYRLIYEFHNQNILIGKDDRIHHINKNSYDDRIENLLKCTIEEHKKFHDVSGKNNMMYRLRDPKKYSETMSRAISGMKNGRAMQVSSSEVFEILVKYIKEIKRRPHNKEALAFARKNNIPFTTFRYSELGCKNLNEYLDKACSEAFCNHKVKSIEFYGYEDVYNLTVDDNHNYFVLTSKQDDKFMTSSGICVKNCGEQPLLCGTTEKDGEFYPWGEACNLGSMNLSKYYDDKKNDIDWKELEKDIQVATRFLDNVIDMSRFPLESITKNVQLNRKIGLGFMGLADVLTLMKVPYNSKAGTKTAEKIIKFINDIATDYSEILAKEKAQFPNQANSSIKRPRRNAAITTLAPTGTISMIADTSSGCEPNFSNVFVKTVMDGKKLYYTNKYFEKALKDAKIYSKELLDKVAANGGMVAGIEEIPEDIRKTFVTAQEINYEWHIKMQAALQKHVHSSISKTINMPSNATLDDVKKAYMMAWELGCKGITIYRDGSKADQVLSTTKTKTETIQKKTTKPRPQKLVGHTYSMQTGCGKLFITINEFPDGKLAELFARQGKSGACVSAFTEAIGRMVSLGFRNDVDVEDLMKQLIAIRCNKPCGFGNSQILSCSDAISKVIKMHLEEKLSKDKKEPVKIEMPKEKHAENGGLCPDCGAELIFTEGCKKCSSCSYSACS